MKRIVSDFDKDLRYFDQHFEIFTDKLEILTETLF